MPGKFLFLDNAVDCIVDEMQLKALNSFIWRSW